MHTRSTLLGTVTAALVVLAALAPAAQPEGRALYVTRWYMKDASQVAAAVDYAAAHRFNMMFCQVFGDARALYDSALAPRSSLVAAGFDALGEAVRRAHAAGLELHAYINTAVVWSGDLGWPADPEHIVNSHPDWSMENAAGVRDVDLAATAGSMVFFCPREPAFVGFLAGIAAEIAANYEIDGIHIDYTRYPTEEHCFCGRHRAAFRALYGADPEPGDARFNRLREDDIFELVMAIREAAHAARPGVRISAALVSPSGRKGQDAQRWLEEGAIDIAVPMLYTDDDAAFESALRAFRERSGGRHVMPSIGATYNKVGSQIDATRRVGASGAAIFTSNTITAGITAELDARFGAAAPPLACPWLDGSADVVPPVISDVRVVGAATTEATVVWHSDEKTRGFVDYGTTPSYGKTESVSSLVFEHAVTLGGLAPSTTYHFRVRSTDAAGNETRGADSTFATTAGGDLEIILDDGDADVLFSGTWVAGTSAGGHDGDYRWTTDQPQVTATASYRPYLTRAGAWEVAVTYVPGTNRVADAPYLVQHEAGSETFTVDQKSRAETWIVLGEFRFPQGWGAAVTIANRASGGDVVVADAVRFRYTGPPPNPAFVRGDTNADGQVNVADAIGILSYLFSHATPRACLDAFDVADRGGIDISNAIRLLSYLFARGEAPKPPFPGAGHDPTPTDPYTCGD